jgi:hypothetical protein
MKLTAQILYNEIRDSNPRSGMYVWIDPDEHSILKLGKLVSDAPFKPLQRTAMHVTVLYHKEALPFGVKPPMDRLCSGSLVRLKVWTDDKQKQVLVAAIDSPELQRLHQELLGEGMQHSFPDYQTHLTLCYDTPMSAQVRLWIEQKNQELADQPLELSFGPQLKAEALS